MYDKPLAIFFSLLILGQAYLFRKLAGTWAFPACLFGLFWFGMTFFPLIIMFSVPVSPWGTAYIFLALLAFSSSAVLFPWERAFKRHRPQPIQLYDNGFLKKIFYLLSLITIACIVQDSLAQGATFNDLIFNVLRAAQDYRALATEDANLSYRIAEILVYAVAVLGGLLMSSASTRWARCRIMLAAFAPSVLNAVAHSTKWALFSSVAFFYAGILTSRISRGDLRLFKKGIAKKAILAGAALAAIAAASFMSRSLVDQDASVVEQRLKFYFASYSSGHLYGFSDWCAAQIRGDSFHSTIRYDDPGRTYGYFTFAPIFRALTGKTVALYDDYYDFTNADGDALLQTNIYTMFQGLIQDFGVPGSLAFMFLLGLVLHRAYYCMLTGQAAWPVAVFIFSIDFFYASYGRSLFTWSGIYFTFLLVWGILLINKGWSPMAKLHEYQKTLIMAGFAAMMALGCLIGLVYVVGH